MHWFIKQLRLLYARNHTINDLRKRAGLPHVDEILKRRETTDEAIPLVKVKEGQPFIVLIEKK